MLTSVATAPALAIAKDNASCSLMPTHADHFLSHTENIETRWELDGVASSSFDAETLSSIQLILSRKYYRAVGEIESKRSKTRKRKGKRNQQLEKQVVLARYNKHFTRKTFGDVRITGWITLPVFQVGRENGFFVEGNVHIDIRFFSACLLLSGPVHYERSRYRFEEYCTCTRPICNKMAYPNQVDYPFDL